MRKINKISLSRKAADAIQAETVKAVLYFNSKPERYKYLPVNF